MSQKYCLVSSQDGNIMNSKRKLNENNKVISNDMPMIEINDFNRDGMHDIAFMDPNSGNLTILYNQYKPVAASNTELCKKHGTKTSELKSTPFFESFPFMGNDQSLIQNIPEMFYGRDIAK